MFFLSDITSSNYARSKGAKDKKKRKVYKLRDGRVLKPNSPVPARDGKHKKVVLAKKIVNGKAKYKVVRYGAIGYSDMRKHKDPKRRERFMKRHKAIKLKSGKPAYKDKFQAAYWSTNKRGGTW